MEEKKGTMIDKLKENIRRFQDIPFKRRLFFLFGIMGIVSSLFAFISSVANQLPAIAVGGSFICVLMMVMNAIFFLVSQSQAIASILCCISLNFVMFPILFFISGGAHSGMPLYFLLGIMVGVLILEGKSRGIILAGSLLIDSFCFWIYFTYYSEDLQLPIKMQCSDMIMSFWIVGVFLIVVLYILIREFEAEQKRLISYNQKLKEKNQLDELTGLYNQRFVRKILERFCEENEKAKEGEQNLLVAIMLDIDFFKQVNDRFGHLRGNEVLIRFSQILTENAEDGQFVIRYGGEEFLIILYGVSIKQAIGIAEAIRYRVEYDKVLRKLTNGGITVSGGVAEYVRGIKAEELIELADKRLYEAKHAGRNRIKY